MIVYYKNDIFNNFFSYDGVKVRKTQKRPKGYEMLKTFGLEANEQGLIEYFEKVKEYSIELETYLMSLGRFENLDLSFFKEDGDNSSLMNTLLYCTRKDRKYLKDYEHVSYDEWVFMDNSYGTGLIAGTPYEGKVYAYDQKKFYSMTYGCRKRKFKFPVKKGRFEILEKEPDTFKFGYYHIKVISKDPRARFLIGFSRKNYYDHFTLNKLKFFRDKLGISLNWELIHDGKPNALIYDDDTLMDSHIIFGWYQDILMKANEKMPKNPLVKFMLNNMFGCQLLKYQPKYRKSSSIKKKSEEEQEKIIPILKKSYTNKEGERVYYTVHKDRIFLYTTARMGYFLPASCRAKMSNLISPILNDVVRIYIDGFICKVNHDEKITKFICKDNKYHEKTLNIINSQKIHFLD